MSSVVRILPLHRFPVRPKAEAGEYGLAAHDHAHPSMKSRAVLCAGQVSSAILRLARLFLFFFGLGQGVVVAVGHGGDGGEAGGKLRRPAPARALASSSCRRRQPAYSFALRIPVPADPVRARSPRALRWLRWRESSARPDSSCQKGVRRRLRRRHALPCLRPATIRASCRYRACLCRRRLRAHSGGVDVCARPCR